MAKSIKAPVVIVGAGPVGLTLALDLAARGIHSVVLEQRRADERPSVKCNHISSRTMEIFRRLGLADEIRGAGEVFGAKQSGINDLKLGRIPRDEEIVLETRGAAEEILDADPDLAVHAQLREEVEDLLGDAVEFLFKS